MNSYPCVKTPLGIPSSRKASLSPRVRGLPSSWAPIRSHLWLLLSRRLRVNDTVHESPVSVSTFPSCWMESVGGRAHVFQAPKSILDPCFLSWHSENICWTELLNILLPYFPGPDLSPLSYGSSSCAIYFNLAR